MHPSQNPLLDHSHQVPVCQVFMVSGLMWDNVAEQTNVLSSVSIVNVCQYAFTVCPVWAPGVVRIDRSVSWLDVLQGD